MLPWTATPLVVAPLAGAVADRLRARRVLATGLALQSLGLGIFAYDATLAPSYLRLSQAPCPPVGNAPPAGRFLASSPVTY